MQGRRFRTCAASLDRVPPAFRTLQPVLATRFERDVRGRGALDICMPGRTTSAGQRSATRLANGSASKATIGRQRHRDRRTRIENPRPVHRGVEFVDASGTVCRVPGVPMMERAHVHAALPPPPILPAALV